MEPTAENRAHRILAHLGNGIYLYSNFLAITYLVIDYRHSVHFYL